MSAAPSIPWNTTSSASLARAIEALPGVYCGPASVAWIAAVWNGQNGKPYDYKSRLLNKQLFPDGPRPFHLSLPGFELNMSDLLQRETEHALRLSHVTYFRADTIHEVLQAGMPLIVRMPAPKVKDGLHYTTLYASETKQIGAMRYIRFYFQDNGVFKSAEPMSPGLSVTGWKKPQSLFPWGAKLVTKA